MKHSFLSINLSTGSYNSFIDRLIDLSLNKVAAYVCVANVHMLVEAHHDKEFRQVVNNSTLCTPDGMPLVWGLKLLSNIKQDRVAGMDLLPDLLKEAENNNISVYFYGGSTEMLSLTESYLTKNYPKLSIAGLYSPPFRQLTPEEEEADIANIKRSGASLLFVALGCPKQEKWMARMNDKISIPMIGIGGALPVMVGMQSRAPRWVQNASLEWLYRLAQEPKRLFKRYALTNTTFLWLLLRAKAFQLLTAGGVQQYSK